MKTKHLCDTCKQNFPECKGEKLTFSIDLDPSLRGAEADKIVTCDSYVNKEPGKILKVQNIKITLTDGRQSVFTGKALFDFDNPDKNKIEKIEFYPAIELSADCLMNH